MGVNVEYFRLCSQENLYFVSVIIICRPIHIFLFFFFFGNVDPSMEKKKKSKD